VPGVNETTVIRNATVVNEGRIGHADLLLRGGIIEKTGTNIAFGGRAHEIDATGLHLFPGVIDDQVHFREPGLTHKGDIRSESRAAVAGGVTSFMEMPNTVPPALTRELLEEKYARAARVSPANYSFYMGVSNANADEVLRIDPGRVCGVKIFMGSSTGNLLVDDETTLEKLFSLSPTLIATHCEDEQTIRRNLAVYREKYGEDIPMACHPLIRSEEACYRSSSHAVELARRHGTRLHVLHISTAREASLFDNTVPLREKRITAEACIHHLWFSDEDYAGLGTRIKWNPAIKTAADRKAVFDAVLDDRIDVIATDHAPHTLQEKSQPYEQAPSGGPLVQHALVAMLECHHRGMISLERIADKMAHRVADCFRLRGRGYVREGYAADLVLVNLSDPWTVDKPSIMAKCGWSPFEGVRFRSRVQYTFVNGNRVYEKGTLLDTVPGQRLLFDPL